MKNKEKYLSQLKTLYISVRKIFKHPIAQFAIILLTIIFIAYFVTNQYKSIRTYISDTSFDLHKLLLALISTVIATLLGNIRWWTLLSWLGKKTDFLEISKYFSLSTLSKYIPGFIWQYASRTFYMEKFKIPISLIGFAIASEYILITAVGGILSSLTYLLTSPHRLTTNQVLLAIIIILFLSIFIAYYPIIIKRFSHLLKIKIPNLQIIYYGSSLILIVVGWTVMSIAYWLIVNALNIQDFSFLTAFFYNATSFTIGNLVIFIPNGIIVRETVLVFLGGGLYNKIPMVISSALFRILILLSELVSALLFLGFTEIRKIKKAS